MLTITDPHEILTDFGKTIGIPDIAFDADGHCCLGFDDMAVDLAVNEGDGHMIVSSEIATVAVDADGAVLLRYLALNHAALITGAGAIGLDTGKRVVRYIERIPLRGLDEAAFRTAMTLIVDRIEKLRDWLASERFEGPDAGGSDRIDAFMHSL
jgi:hypothetical protein